MFFSWNHSTNIMYPNRNCHISFPITKTKLDSCYQSMFVLLIPNKSKGWNFFFPKPMCQHYVSQWELPISHCHQRKETRLLPRTNFIPLIANEMTGWNALFQKPKHQLSYIAMIHPKEYIYLTLHLEISVVKYSRSKGQIHRDWVLI